ncbi:MAG: hypothetical protein RLZZ358_1336, partial [Bacteroidota bacterium]
MLLYTLVDKLERVKIFIYTFCLNYQIMKKSILLFAM